MAASKQDYQFIAAVFRREHELLDDEEHAKITIGDAPRERLNIMASKIAKHFEFTNPDFDMDRFRRACSTSGYDSIGSGCFCTECLREVDEETFDALDGMCELCDRRHWVEENQDV